MIGTPHLGASTDEAQEKAGVSVAKSVRLALAGELVPDAVNVAGGVIASEVRPGIPLIEKLGKTTTRQRKRVARQWEGEGTEALVARIHVDEGAYAGALEAAD